MRDWKEFDYHDFETLGPVTTFSEDTELEGDLRYDSSLLIKGKFKGSIDTTGFLWVDKGAEVQAEIKARFVKLGGVIRGNIQADDHLEVLEGARLYGDVKTARIRICDGTVFEGKCEMTA